VPTSDPRASFGKQVHKSRLERRLSQEKLAELADLHRNYVGGVERGERNIAIINIVALAYALKVNPPNFSKLNPKRLAGAPPLCTYLAALVSNARILTLALLRSHHVFSNMHETRMYSGDLYDLACFNSFNPSA
jgi:transcriptional regulator with XRE-family HTH domain